MTEEQKKENDSIVNLVIRQIDTIAYNMQDNRIDGYVKEGYRNNLLKIKKRLDKHLE